ncbi:photosynthetic complex putative assembly protein PuhB [Roseateles sp. SL47]|uniref:photosynthetic complex putative assembly protein PuhB n=1 Tax=Roseateles sp. SL47 TaxID=2995138 RepID=UPI00226FCF3E|nr:photosynthetic complex putative assembly protein PuhB [Roseateles sp. SL47]WAC73223.1 photosynthetic complex putative assembly protein PuhB [Roseateles sp. SL47]
MRAVSNLVNVLAPAHEHEFEAMRGLPEALPDGERQLWQGSPDARLLARQAVHLDLVIGYFLLLLGWRVATGWADGQPVGQILMGLAGMLPLILLACGLLATIAWMMARSTVYTITNRRVVLRVGIVLSITFNLPFSQILSAGWRARGRGGDIVLTLGGSDRIAYLHLWPHARPWHLRRTQPMLRALADAPTVAALLAEALRQAEADRQTLPMRAVPTDAGATAAHPLPQAA